MTDFDAVIIGAGVVGLAIGRKLSIEGKSVAVIEEQDTFGTITSSRNSGVIHAGVYYDKGSLKAKFCPEGNRRIYEYCEKYNVPHLNTGKFIVATSNDEIDKKDYIEVKSKRIKSTPVIGKVESIEWEPNENSKKISDNFSDDEEINSLSMELGNIKVQSLHDNFSGFSVELEFKRREKNINNQNWESLNKIAHICLNYKA